MNHKGSVKIKCMFVIKVCHLKKRTFFTGFNKPKDISLSNNILIFVPETYKLALDLLGFLHIIETKSNNLICKLIGK